MPITAASIEHPDGHWHGWVWTVDEEVLAPYIAHIAIGSYRNVRRILHELDGERALEDTFVDAATIAGARKLLVVRNPANPYHRDGWLFQTLSWIAARLQENGNQTLSQTPHKIHAHKGFDALELTLSSDASSLERLTVGEDKATENSRSTVREVWQELSGLESGARRNELRTVLSTLLESRPDLDEIALIDQIVWQFVMGYRVAVTDAETGEPVECATKLFHGFEGVVSGGIDRRQVALLHVKDLRSWMERLAALALDHLDSLGR